MERTINILDVYANGAVVAEVYEKHGTMIYRGAAMNVPYHICKCYAKDHFYEENKYLIKIWL